MTAVRSQICDLDRSGEGVYFQSNHGRRFMIVRWRFNANRIITFASKHSSGNVQGITVADPLEVVGAWRPVAPVHGSRHGPD
jgi:hypothetical protein